jgi:chromosome condensin MukBEF ATPase and DNA-binding subunit MukB
MDIPNKHHLTPIDECEEMPEIKNIFEHYRYMPDYEQNIKKYEKIHTVLKRDRQGFLHLENHFAPDPFDRYQKKARDYITHYQLDKKFKH